MSVFLTRSLWTVAVVFLSGCTLTPDYQRPVAPIPAAWPAAFAGEPQGGSAASIAWQDFVRNDEARELVRLALENNRDLKTALLDIEAARAQYRIQRADRYPVIDGQASSQRQRVPADIGSPGQDRISDRYEVGLGLTAFELDLFGRLRSLSEAALQEYLATEEAARAVRISLIVSVLESYVVADGALKRRLLTQETLQTRQVSLNLISHRRSQGVASALDYQDAIALTEEARAELERTDREFRRARNALAMLVGNTVDRDAILTAPVSGSIVSDQVHAGLPAELLQRRPDILAAERRLMARNADIGAARAAFFPRVSLTGSYGSASSELSGLFEAGSGAWTFVPRIDLPIFRGGQNRASLDLASVRRDRAVVAYERTIQTAFREVVDALDGRETLAREAQARLALAAASTQALTLAEARYKQGVDGFLRYLDSQRSNFADRVGAIDAATEHDVAVVQLFGAVGGDWSATSEL